MQAQADVVDLDRGAIVLGRSDRDLELARQEREFRMQRECWRRISAQMRGSSISSGATPAHWSVVTLRMQLPQVCIAMHADLGEIGQRIRQLGELDPVELDVLPRGEMAVAAVVAARDMRQRPHLLRTTACRRESRSRSM